MRHSPLWRTTFTALLSSAALFPSVSVHAFSIKDHVAVTEVAFAELSACGMLGGHQGASFSRNVTSANVDEDLNLIRKWSKYSHYFHPYKKLDMRREDSSATIEESQLEIWALLKHNNTPENLAEVQALLGRMIHHLQDASVPAHVAPVSHTSFTDGFENLTVSKTFFSKTGDFEHCQELAVRPIPRDMMEVLRGNAIATLQSFTETLDFTSGRKRSRISWGEAFWIEDTGRDFGAYGRFGNEFGTASIRDIRVSPADYIAFKAGRMRAAVEASETAILWLQQNMR